MTEFQKSSIFNLQFSLSVGFSVFLFVILSTQSSPAQTWHAVKWVEDGDTIVLATGQHIRYLGINAPEVKHKEQKAQPWGYKAKSFNETLVKNNRIRLEFDTERYDQYGRMLAYVFLADGVFINFRLLQSGLAFYLYRTPNVKYEQLLYQAQLSAMASRNGLWHDWKEKNAAFIGNSKSRRFHSPACPYARRIDAAHRISFSSKWDAFQAGYAPAKECIVKYWGDQEED